MYPNPLATAIGHPTSVTIDDHQGVPAYHPKGRAASCLQNPWGPKPHADHDRWCASCPWRGSYGTGHSSRCPAGREHRSGTELLRAVHVALWPVQHRREAVLPCIPPSTRCSDSLIWYPVDPRQTTGFLGLWMSMLGLLEPRALVGTAWMHWAENITACRSSPASGGESLSAAEWLSS